MQTSNRGCSLLHTVLVMWCVEAFRLAFRVLSLAVEAFASYAIPIIFFYLYM